MVQIGTEEKETKQTWREHAQKQMVARCVLRLVSLLIAFLGNRHREAGCAVGKCGFQMGGTSGGSHFVLKRSARSIASST